MGKITKVVIVIVLLLLIGSIILCSILLNNKSDITNNINEISEEISKEVVVIPELTEIEEQTLEVQEINLENESFEEQGEIAYNGAEKVPNVSLGSYKGLTYYSQIDSRWKNIPYTSTGNSEQTIGISGCGPTAAAMIVSSIKGSITPDKMAELFVNYGYRSANNGTYWSAFKWIADVFDIGYKQVYKLDDAIEALKNNNYVVAACGQGLFTYGGHFVILIGIDGDNIKIYDPYLYKGKFETSTRRGKISIDEDGYTLNCSINNFRQYANYSSFFCYQNDRIDITENTTTVETVPNDEPYVSETSYQAIITANIGLNIRNGASINYSRNGGYSKGEIVTIIAESNGWGKTEKGWIYLEYTEKVDNEKEITKKVTAKIGLNIRSGPSTNSNIIGAYPYGKEVIVYSEEEGWAKVKYNGNYGYMYSKYLK